MSASRRLLALLLAATTLTVGCIGQSPGGDAPLETSAADPQGQPTLTVEVVDLARVPVQGAEVTVVGNGTALVERTDATGQATFQGVATDEVRIQVRAPGYQDREISAQVTGGRPAAETVVLPPLVKDGTFVQSFEFEGFFECSATYLIVTGDCLAVVEAVAQEAGASVDNNGTNARFTFPFELGRGWSSVSITQTWQEPVAAAGSMMRLNLEPVDKNNTEGHGQRFARTDGTSPIQLTVENDGQAHETASDEDLVLPEEGGLARTRTFHLGFEELHRPGGTGFLGAGAAIQQQFTVYVNVTYGGS